MSPERTRLGKVGRGMVCHGPGCQTRSAWPGDSDWQLPLVRHCDGRVCVLGHSIGIDLSINGAQCNRKRSRGSSTWPMKPSPGLLVLPLF